MVTVFNFMRNCQTAFQTGRHVTPYYIPNSMYERSDFFISLSVLFFFFFLILFMSFWLCWVSVAACGLSLIAASRDHFLVVVCGLLIVVASLGAEHRLQSVKASVVAALRP